MYTDLGMTQREVAATLGIDHSTVSRALGAFAPSELIDFGPPSRAAVPSGYRELMAALKAVGA